MKSFQSLTWHEDRMLLNDLVFRLEHFKNKDWELGKQCFMFYKTKKLIDQYEHLFKTTLSTSFDNVFELGTFDGGSTAFWFEMLSAKKYVTIDIKDRNDSLYFEQFIKKYGASEKIKTYWRTNQRDKIKLREIYEKNFNTPLDIVIDDASHLYNPTKSSFEALYPLLRTGGLYIIEDWAWGHWEDFFNPNHEWASQQILTEFVTELVEAVGSNSSFGHINIYKGLAVLEKGSLNVDPDNFTLESIIKRRPNYHSTTNSMIKFLKKILGRF